MLEPDFWQKKALSEMSREEWEALCDGCGKCCLHKLEDEDTGEVFYTDVACKLLDIDSCQCSNYANRKQYVPDCLVLTVEDIAEFHWLPATCAYRLLAEEKPLFPWHPLIAGKQAIHEQGISVCHKVFSEENVHASEMEEHIIHWVE